MNDIRQAELVDQIVERVRHWGVTGLASALLDGIRPVAFLGGQALWVAQPTLGLASIRASGRLCCSWTLGRSR